MPSTINASTSSGLVTSADNSGELQLQTNSGTTAVTIDTAQNVTFAKPIAISGNTLGAGNASSFKNRIINGAMTIDQRNAGASVTAVDGSYCLDRYRILSTQASKFSVQQDAGAVTPPVGFNDYLGVTSLSAYSVTGSDIFAVQQRIEGFNTADLNWGTANAKTVTLSFWVYSSLTGTFGGSLQNSGSNRSYPYTYTISSANTWEYKTITIAGDTTGTWLVTNGIGIRVTFGLGVSSTFSGTAGAWAAGDFRSATGATSVVGTNGATFYITGVQFEVGSAASSFDYRPYGTELALCQRYYYKTITGGGTTAFGLAYANTTTDSASVGYYPVTMRISPTALEQTGTATDYQIQYANANTTCSAVPAFSASTNANAWRVVVVVASGLTAGRAGMFFANSTNAYLAWSAEL
jgi:hypothetical protein